MLYTPKTSQNQIIAKLIELRLFKPNQPAALIKPPVKSKPADQADSQCYVLGYN